MFIPESALTNTHDAYVCLEKIILTMRVALPIQTSGEEVALEEDISFHTSILTDNIVPCIEEDLGIVQNIPPPQNENTEGLSSSSSLSLSMLEKQESLELTKGADFDDSLDEVGDFLSAEPLTPIKQPSNDSVAPDTNISLIS